MSFSSSGDGANSPLTRTGPLKVPSEGCLIRPRLLQRGGGELDDIGREDVGELDDQVFVAPFEAVFLGEPSSPTDSRFCIVLWIAAARRSLSSFASLRL